MSEKTILITGAAGMIGFHLIEYYREHEPTTHIVAMDFDIRITASPYTDLATCECFDIRDRNQVGAIIEKYQPALIYHLAAQSLPTVSWEKPGETLEINSLGTINLFEAVKKLREKTPEYNPIVITACSSAEYGQSLLDAKEPVTEDALLLPLHPYGVSKVAQDLLSFQYFKGQGIRTIRARIFNTTGPRKTHDAVSDFVQRAYDITQGKTESLRVGNLETRRAITDVRDLVHALVLLAEKGIPGEAYNISGEHIYQMKDVITLIEKVLGQSFTITVDPNLVRPTDEPLIIGNSKKLKKQTGWKQSIDLETTIRDMLTVIKK
jgi:GDP-4-dehydro-6-deoxy-D-mannose reductase